MAEQIQHIAVGFRMKEGLTCLAFNTERGVLLAVSSGSYEPYVTWKYDFDKEKMEYVMWAGHYFRDILAAAQDYNGRF